MKVKYISLKNLNLSILLKNLLSTKLKFKLKKQTVTKRRSAKEIR